MAIDENKKLINNKGDTARLCSKCNFIDHITTHHKTEYEAILTSSDQNELILSQLAL